MVGRIKQDQAMHLSGESNGANFRTMRVGLSQYAANRDPGGVPPVFGALLGPQGTLHQHVLMRSGKRVADLTAGVHQQGPGPARAHVDSKPVHSFC